jgi:tRNA A-37 threonylcarbamoyl transferase component Bud32
MHYRPSWSPFEGSAQDAVPVREPRPLPLPGELLGPYRLIFELASGGMATIYLALADARAGAHRLVAVKRLHRHLVDDTNYRTMFLDEARIASQIRHPNVCSVFDYGDQGGSPYIVMEYLAGESTAAIWSALPRDASVSMKQRRARLAARIVADICEALHAAHELRSSAGDRLDVVHRDVSPENLIVTYDGVVKLVDFGIASAAQQEHLTEAGVVKGKLAYIQPETLRGKRPDRRADIFSLGVVLWELMTGERLFRRDSALETLQAVGEALVPAPSSVLGVASELDSIVLRALEADPDKRFASAREFGKELNAALGSTGCHAGTAQIAEWMEELFPGGRAKQEQLQVVATLYEPFLTDAREWSTKPREVDDQAVTLAMATRAITLPATRFRAAVASSPPEPRRWWQPMTAFALGSFLSAVLFLATKPMWPTGNRAAGLVALDATPLRGAARPMEQVPQAELIGPALIGGMRSAEQMEAAASWRLVLPVTGTWLEEAMPELLLEGESARELDPRRSDLRRPTMTSLRLKRLLATAQPLELRPEFASYAQKRLFEASLADPSRAAQLALPTLPRRAPRVTILLRSNSRFYAPGRARLALR